MPRQDDHQRQRRDDQEPVLERVEPAVGPAAEVAAQRARRSSPAPPRSPPPRSRRRSRPARPTRIWEKTSEPFSVVPSQMVDAGRSEHVEARGVRVIGSDGLAEDGHEGEQADHPEPDAAAPGAQQEIADTCRSLVANSAAAPARSLRAGRPAPGSCRLHPRVEVEVQAVGEQVGQDHPGGEDEEGSLEHREVLVLDRLEAELAQARPGEDRSRS